MRTPWTLVAVALVACVGGKGTTRSGGAAPSNKTVTADVESRALALERIKSPEICGAPCQWADTQPTATSEALAVRARDALLADLVHSVKGESPSDAICAPNLAAQLREAPDLVIYVSGDVPESLFSTSGLRVLRASLDEYERAAAVADTPVAFLQLAFGNPVTASGVASVGVTYSCENRNASDGIQNRSGVVLQRDDSTLYVTSESRFDQ